ncbi:chitinase 1 [Ilyonectria robusta]
MSPSRKSRIASSVSNVMYTNAVYFPNYRIYQGDTPGMLNYSCINHVYYAYASVSVDGGVFVILSIGGGNSPEVFPVVASSTLLRDNFARSARGLVEASGLDGIDSKCPPQRIPASKFFDWGHMGLITNLVKVAWEYPCDAKQGYDFLALLAAVRIHLPEDQFILTAALPANKAVLQFIDLAVISDYLDFVNLMAYDFFGAWTPKSGHHAQLYNISKDETSGSSGVSYLMSHGFPAQKILLGIPTYGRSFLHATGPGQKFRGGGGDDGTFEYNQLPRKGCKEVVDKRHVAAQCIGADGGFVTYDNPDTVKVKAGFCKQKGLGVSTNRRW